MERTGELSAFKVPSGISTRQADELLVHGTSYSNWISIQTTPKGLMRMDRDEIYFVAQTSDAERGQIPRVNDASILIYVDRKRAEADGISFETTADSVTTHGCGGNGNLPMKYFSKVVDSSNGGVLWTSAKLGGPRIDKGLVMDEASRIRAQIKNIPRIDVHTHILPRNIDICKTFSEKGYVYLEHHRPDRANMMKDSVLFREIKCNCYDPKERLKDMDDFNTSVQVLSTVPVMFSYWATNKKDAVTLARHINDDLALTVTENPKKFIALGTLPMQFPDESVLELERCMTVLKMKGVQIGTHVEKWELSDPALFPIYAKAEELGAALFIHPWDMMGAKDMQKYWLPWLVGMPAETCRATCHILFAGILDKFPKLRICFAHGGGSFPYTAGRVEHGYSCRPDLCATDNPNSPMSYIQQPAHTTCPKCEEDIVEVSCDECFSVMCRQCDSLFHARGKMKLHNRKASTQQTFKPSRFWVDSLVHDTRALEFLLGVIGEDRVLLGSDYPFPLGEWHPGQMVASHPTMSTMTKRKLLAQNACEFLNINMSDYISTTDAEMGLSHEELVSGEGHGVRDLSTPLTAGGGAGMSSKATATSYESSHQANSYKR